MPELPEVETIARTLAPEAVGREILRVEVLDPVALQPDPAAFQALAVGRRIESVGRRAKLLLLNLSPPGAANAGTGAVIAVHLRMTGQVFVLAPDMAMRHTRAVLHLSGGARLAFADARRFGSMHAFAAGSGAGSIDSWPFYASLGPEPLTMTAAEFRSRLGFGRARIKALLLDQRVIAGIGNIYADESLFRAGIRPDTPADQIAPKKRDALFAAVQAVLNQAIAENGSSIRDYRDAHGDAGAFQNHFRAYGREGEACQTCGEAMRAMRVAGRTSTFCPRCQPAPR
ncbi:bifunctional DNA-formamidopyrimidine glycosylase/DNA-(apurinic or apyrimidinic site) lyase [Humidesulfovibrio idahonensis]